MFSGQTGLVKKRYYHIILILTAEQEDAIVDLFNKRQWAYVKAGRTWASSRENLSSGLLTKGDSNQSPQLQRLARKIELFFVASLDMVLFKKRITKALIRLCGCTGWSAPLLSANLQRQVSRYEAHIIII